METTVNLSAVGSANVGNTSAVGVVVGGFDPGRVVNISLRSTPNLGWSAWPADSGPGIPTHPWSNSLVVTQGDTSVPVGAGDARSFNFGSANVYASAQEAFDAFPGGSVTGASTYTLWLYDPAPADDRGGLTVRLSEVVPLVASAWPASLPSPIELPYQPRDRRAKSELPGVRQTRTLWRDSAALAEVEWFFTRSQLAAFREFVEDTLVAGTAWFSAGWRSPAGGTQVYKFRSPPAYSDFIAGQGGWRVSASLEVRGRSMLPQVPE